MRISSRELQGTDTQTRHEWMGQAIGEDAVVLERTIDVHVKSPRRKLGEAANLIETARGAGYRFRETPWAASESH